MCVCVCVCVSVCVSTPRGQIEPTLLLIAFRTTSAAIEKQKMDKVHPEVLFRGERGLFDETSRMSLIVVFFSI